MLTSDTHNAFERGSTNPPPEKTWKEKWGRNSVYLGSRMSPWQGCASWFDRAVRADVSDSVMLRERVSQPRRGAGSERHCRVEQSVHAREIPEQEPWDYADLHLKYRALPLFLGRA